MIITFKTYTVQVMYRDHYGPLYLSREYYGTTFFNKTFWNKNKYLRTKKINSVHKMYLLVFSITYALNLSQHGYIDKVYLKIVPVNFISLPLQTWHKPMLTYAVP